MPEQEIRKHGLRLQNSSTPMGDEWWQWEVWVEASEETLDRVRSVRYALHPTFRDPVRMITDRASKFKLRSSGWGEFSIAATATMDDGEEVPLERWLTLEGPGDPAQDSPGDRPRVFISYSGLDRPFVAPLLERLRKEGIEVLSPDTLLAGESIHRSVEEALQKADVVALVTRGELRGWAQEELTYALERGKTVVPILVGGTSTPAALSAFQAIRLDSVEDLDAVGDAVTARVNDAFYPDER
jgi:prokaryotic YEATS domain/TIR domain